jgi:methionine sulfoxide reductase heme-binding subunit
VTRLDAFSLPSGSSALWYYNRASGLVLLVLFTAVVLLGQLSTARDRPLAPRFVSVALHRNLSAIAFALLAVHVATSVADSFVDISLVDAVVPFLSPYRPVWLGLGTVALDVLVAVGVTTLLRHRIPLHTWRTTHALSYLAWMTAVVHGLGTGTDTRRELTLVVTFACVTLVVLGTLLRVATLARVPVPARALLFVAVAVLPLLLTTWLRSGPLRPDWSRRAGTPPANQAQAVGQVRWR